MKVLVSRNEFMDVVTSVSSVIPTRSTQPILANMLISAEDDSLILVATDREQTLKLKITADTVEKGALAVPAKMLLEVLKGLDDGELEIKVEDLRMSIVQGRHRVKLPGVNVEDYPKTELLESPKVTFSLPIDMLLQFLDLVAFAMPRDTARPTLAGLFCQFFPDEMRMVATDGHKLAMLKKKDDFKIEESLEMFIPENAASRLNSLLGKIKSDDIEITAGVGSAQFQAEDFLFQTKLISEKFPDYERVIPSENELIMISEKYELNKSVRLMTIIANKITSQVKFKISKGSIEMSASDLDMDSEGFDTLTVDYDGEPLEIGFNGKMLLEILEHIPSDQLKFKLKNPATACIITPMPQPEDFEYLALIMPLRI